MFPSNLFPVVRIKGLSTAIIFTSGIIVNYGFLFDTTPVYGRTKASDDQKRAAANNPGAGNSINGLCPYYGRRKAAPCIPPPVQAVVNSGIDSNGVQFLLPFQGGLSGGAKAPEGASNQAATDGSNSSIDCDRRYPAATYADQGASGTKPNYESRVTDKRIAAAPPQSDVHAQASGHNGASKHGGNKSSDDPGDLILTSWPGRAGARSASGQRGLKLYGGVTAGRVNEFGVRIDDLLTAALTRNTRSEEINHTVAHFYGRTSKTVSGLKDSLDEMTDYKGFSRSMEAADVILDKNLTAKNAACAEYIKQRYVDQLHPKIVTKVMQIAMGMGLKDPVRGKEMVRSGAKGLSELVGEKQAQNTVAMLSEWTDNLKVPEEIFNQPQWDVDGFRDKVNLTTKMAMTGDPVVNDIIKSIRKYDRSNTSNKAFGAFQLLANISEIASPGLAIPFVVEVARVGAVEANGGSEPHKLLKELYYDKRIESRYRTINEESQLAVTNYQLAMANHNTTLLACSESILSQLVGPECVTDVLNESIFHPQPSSTGEFFAGSNILIR